MAKSTAPDASLKRLGGGRWQTRDERFTIEPQSGTWVVVDAEATDELGLPLVRGPFLSLTAAKAAIAELRDASPAVSPLEARAERLRGRPSDAATPPRGSGSGTARASRRASTPPPSPPEPVEPRWITELEPDDARRARRLISALTASGAPDPEGLARRDIAGKVPAVAAFALARAVRALGPSAGTAAILGALLDGRDADLGVRWRLVDGEGRPIAIDPDDVREP